MEMEKKNLHVMVMAFPAQGHVNPLLHLSTHLALHGVVVSFILSRSFKRNMDTARLEAGINPPLPQLGLDLRFLEIPDIVVPHDITVTTGGLRIGDKLSFEEMLRQAESYCGFVEETVLRSRDGPHPISCIISDNFLYWTQDLANKLGIKRIWVTTSNATTFSTSCQIFSMDKNHLQASKGDFLPSLDSTIKKEILSTYAFNLERKKIADILFGGIGESFCAVVNSFEDLESYVLDDALVMGTARVRFLGPMLPPSFFGMDTAHIEASLRGACACKEDVNCIKWLDTQPPCSVLYIAFGSVAALTPNQLEEIAKGIERSQKAFLWVLRSPANQYLPPGFLERLHGIGLIVSWAPQLRVLRHKSIGGFLTHCGWNSIMESISTGVPMLCLPIFAEQPANALLVTKLWKVGMPLEKTEVGENENGVVMMVTKEEVERKVRALIGGEEDIVVDIRHHSRSLKEVVRKAFFGSTNDTIVKLIADLQKAASEAQF